jgi:beta-lactamase class C
MPSSLLTRRAAAALIGAAAMSLPARARAEAPDAVETIVNRHVRPILAHPGGAAVAVRLNGEQRFFNYGMADQARPISSDALFNLGSVGKVFDTALLALAQQQGELNLDDPAANYVEELQHGRDIRRVTLRQLASYTSGFVLPQDHPPWEGHPFTLPQFLARLEAWTADAGHEPGRQAIYSHAGFILIHLALERRFDRPYDELMRERLLDPLGLRSTTLPVASAHPHLHPRGEIPSVLAARAVQGYSGDDEPIGAVGDLQGFYHWLGTGQMYASARDMAVFLAANLGELPGQDALQQAMRLAHRGVFLLDEGVEQAMAWEVRKFDVTMVDKYGGMNNASAYIGLVPERSAGIVILGNRGGMEVEEAGRRALLALVRG